jgi:putative colanic acid biosynthesis glycosyltransferase WcaI
VARVLLHSLVFSPDSVSTAYLMSELAVDLKGLGHSVTVLTTTPHYNLDTRALARQPLARRWLGAVYYSELDRIPVWHVKLPMKGTRVWLRALDYVRFHAMSVLLGLGRRLGPQDIVIATSPPLTIALIGWLLAARWRAPAVYKVAELYPDLAIDQGTIRSAAAIAVLKWLERVVYSKNAMMVPIADQFHAALRARGVPANKLCTIPDCVDTDQYRPLPRSNAFSEAHGLTEEFVVLYGGNIGLVQDWDSVLYAAAATADLPVTFAIVGDGNRREWLAAEVERRRLSKVKLFGYQPRELMAQVLASSDVNLIPMTRAGAQGGFPSKVYTIMACGKPIIASALPDSGMAKLIALAECGRVVDPEDPQGLAQAVLNAYHNRAALPDEGMRGRLLVESAYSRRAVALRYDALIRSLVAS